MKNKRIKEDKKFYKITIGVSKIAKIFLDSVYEKTKHLKDVGRIKIRIENVFDWSEFNDEIISLDVDFEKTNLKYRTLTSFLVSLKEQRIIKDYEIEDPEVVNSPYEYDERCFLRGCGGVEVRLKPEIFNKYYEKQFGQKITPESYPVINIKKHKKYLNKIPTAQQEILLVDLFFNKKPNQIINGDEMIEYVGSSSNFGVKGKTLIHKLRNLLIKREMIINEGKNLWKLKL